MKEQSNLSAILVMEDSKVQISAISLNHLLLPLISKQTNTKADDSNYSCKKTCMSKNMSQQCMKERNQPSILCVILASPNMELYSVHELINPFE